jgi:hypothetical protein
MVVLQVVVVSVALVLLLAITSSEAQFQQQEPLESDSAIDPAQQQQQVAPEVKPHVSILKQINQINKDGSYVLRQLNSIYRQSNFKYFIQSVGTLMVSRLRTAGDDFDFLEKLKST